MCLHNVNLIIENNSSLNQNRNYDISLTCDVEITLKLKRLKDVLKIDYLNIPYDININLFKNYLTNY